jgi:hypothetical protein
MSLKAFHVLFITISSLMLFGFGAWMLRAYRGPEGGTADLVWAIAAMLAGASLLVYEGFFLKKLKNVSYL